MTRPARPAPWLRPGRPVVTELPALLSCHVQVLLAELHVPGMWHATKHAAMLPDRRAPAQLRAPSGEPEQQAKQADRREAMRAWCAHWSSNRFWPSFMISSGQPPGGGRSWSYPGGSHTRSRFSSVHLLWLLALHQTQGHVDFVLSVDLCPLCVCHTTQHSTACSGQRQGPALVAALTLGEREDLQPSCAVVEAVRAARPPSLNAAGTGAPGKLPKIYDMSE